MFLRMFRAIAVLSVAILPLAAQPSTLLNGTVISQAGQPVAGARLRVTASVAAGGEVLSDASGHFVFRLLPPGTYDLEIDAAGFYPAIHRGVPVSYDEPFEIEIRLAQTDPTPEVRSGETNVASVRIFYATDRKRTDDDRPPAFYGGERNLGAPLQYGTAEVTVPYRHTKAQLETPTSVLGMSFQPDPRKHFVLAAISPSREEPFLRAVSSQLQRPDANSVLIFIHGYANTFEEGAMRLAQLTLDIDFRGVPILFSWPSVGSVAAYKKDEGNVEWATFHFQAFLEKIAATYPGRPIYLVGHSMGTRALSYAIRNLSVTTGRASGAISQIVFAAPDIDAAVFRELSATFRKVAGRVTLYVSADDFALKQSRRLSGYPRAGQGGAERLLLDGVDTVDCTGLDAGFLAHSYYAENLSVVSDVSRVIRGASVTERKSLTPMHGPGGTFYTVGK